MARPPIITAAERAAILLSVCLRRQAYASLSQEWRSSRPGGENIGESHAGRRHPAALEPAILHCFWPPSGSAGSLWDFLLYFTTLLPHIQPCLVINIHFMSWQPPSSPTFYRSSYISAFALHRRNGIGPRRRAPRWYPSSTRLNNQQRLQKKGPAAFPADGIAAAILLRWRPPLPSRRAAFASPA